MTAIQEPYRSHTVPKIKKTYRIDSELLSELEIYANFNNMSQTEALEHAIRIAIHPPDSSHTQSDDVCNGETGNVWKELFLQEHEKLLALTDKIADSLQASQTLQAMDKPAAETLSLESVDKKVDRKTRWQRLKEAWRG